MRKIRNLRTGKELFKMSKIRNLEINYYFCIRNIKYLNVASSCHFFMPWLTLKNVQTNNSIPAVTYLTVANKALKEGCNGKAEVM